MPSYDVLTFGKRLEQALKEFDISQKEFAERLGVSSSAISQWKTDPQRLNIKLFARLCNLLEISPNELLSETKRGAASGSPQVSESTPSGLIRKSEVLEIESTYVKGNMTLVSSNLQHDAWEDDVQQVVKANIEGGAHYTFIFPKSFEAQGALRRAKKEILGAADLVHTNWHEIEIDPDEFRLIPFGTHILICAPAPNTGLQEKMFLEIPDLGDWWVVLSQRTAASIEAWISRIVAEHNVKEFARQSVVDEKIKKAQERWANRDYLLRAKDEACDRIWGIHYAVSPEELIKWRETALAPYLKSDYQAADRLGKEAVLRVFILRKHYMAVADKAVYALAVKVLTDQDDHMGIGIRWQEDLQDMLSEAEIRDRYVHPTVLTDNILFYDMAGEPADLWEPVKFEHEPTIDRFVADYKDLWKDSLSVQQALSLLDKLRKS